MDKQYYHFKKNCSRPSVETSSELFYVCEEDADGMMLCDSLLHS
jgi:hypothetical protein